MKLIAWRDDSYTGLVITLMGSVLPGIVYAVGVFLTCWKLQHTPIKIGEEIIASLGLVFFVKELYTTIGFFYEKTRTIFFAYFATDRLIIKPYIGKITTIDLGTIRAVNGILKNYITKQHKLYIGDPPGFDIVLTTGKRYHCSPRVKDVQGFRAELLKELKEAGRSVEIGDKD